MTDLNAVLKLLKDKLSELDSDAQVKEFSGGTFRAWAFSVDSILARAFGPAAMRLRDTWARVTAGLPWPHEVVILGAQEIHFKLMFQKRLPEVRATLQTIIDELETFGAPRAEEEGIGTAARPKVFIAHGGESEALNKLCSFLDDLGAKPLVVERLPSEGRSVNENVEYYMEMAHCAIVLATGDDPVDGRLQARANVHIELGRLQERFPGRIIYLLEEDAAFPSNVNEKVWERFSDGNMEKAHQKVIREFTAFGLLGAWAEPKADNVAVPPPAGGGTPCAG